MIVRSIDISGDFTFGRGKANYKTGKDAIMQSIQTHLKSWKGDCFFALDDGVDYNNFLDRNTKTFLDNDIKRVILQSDGVIRIDSFSSEIGEDRDYTSNASVMTIYGIIEVGI